MKKLVLALLLMACQRQSPPPPPPAVDAAADAGVDAAASLARVVDAGPPSAELRAAALKDLDQGRTLSRAKDWSNALEAFDRALVVMPDDPRRCR